MIKCWHCNEFIQVLPDGWVCPRCGQHGEDSEPVDTWQEGVIKNRPYREGIKVTHNGTTKPS